MLRELQQLSLHLEQKLLHRRGKAMGWTNASEKDRRMFRKVAEAATADGVARLKVREFPLRLKIQGKNYKNTAIKIYNEHGTHLSEYWRLVDDVRSQVGYSDHTDEALEAAIKKTIADKKSGVLQMRINARDEVRHREYLSEDDLYN